MSGNDITTTYAANVQRPTHLAVVSGGSGTGAAGYSPTGSVAGGGATAYAAPIQTPPSPRTGGVLAVAAQYLSFEDALIPMVLASGVSSEAAGAVATAILRSPELRAQAERAFQQAHLNDEQTT